MASAPALEDARRGALANYTTAEAAAFLRVSPNKLRGLVKSGDIRPDIPSGAGRRGSLYAHETLQAYVRKVSKRR